MQRKYLRQYAIDPEKPLNKAWAHIKAKKPTDAAITGMDVSLLGIGTVYAYIAENKPNNRHSNGIPICVHRFELKIGG